MKQRGFTLMELLMVIIVIAIISIIAVPSIIGVIDKAKLQGLKSSANALLDAGNLYLTQNTIEQDIKFNIDNNVMTSEQTDKTLKYKGYVKNGIVVLKKTNVTTLCIDNGENYVLKTAGDSNVIVGDGVCKAYKDSSGEFSISTACDDVIQEYEDLLERQKSEYEELLKNQKEDYESQLEFEKSENAKRISGLEKSIQDKKAIFLGEFTQNSTIDVSSINAKSVDEFLVVTDSSATVKSTADGSYGVNLWKQNFTGNSESKYTPPKLELKGTNLEITCGKLDTSFSALNANGNNSTNINVKVYYIGDVESK